MRLVWLGSLLMVLGGVLAATDRRYRKLARKDQAQAAAQTASS